MSCLVCLTVAICIVELNKELGTSFIQYVKLCLISIFCTASHPRPRNLSQTFTFSVFS